MAHGTIGVDDPAEIVARGELGLGWSDLLRLSAARKAEGP
jgi:hypothetical protein